MVRVCEVQFKFGKVADVFIPRRKDIKGGNFGFVRFKDVKDPNALRVRLNSIWFGSFKLRVTIAEDKYSIGWKRIKHPTFWLNIENRNVRANGNKVRNAQFFTNASSLVLGVGSS
ncbi:hypothetical protein REPUB_Repub16aG0056800 [Reevesia pubescens]